MGVPGLWKILNKAGQSRSFTNLTVVEGFEGNKSEKRCYRMGVDASIWYHHASFSTQAGDKPALCCLFFRLCTLSRFPVLPVFVFDGRERPKIKRGSKMGKAGSHSLTKDFKKLIDMFGMEWRMAKGEAEAELAYLNRAGFIDAIMTDDVDVFVFGACTVMKNMSISLSGNKSNPALNTAGKKSKFHAMIYKAECFSSNREIGLSAAGLILFALVAGGDYSGGIPKFGPVVAHGLARCGFGEQLLEAWTKRAERNMALFLVHWRESINTELRINSQGFLSSRFANLTVPQDFPDLEILGYYANPVDSTRDGGRGGGHLRDRGDPNLPQIAAFCEENFEWGYRSVIIKRFRDLLWEASVIRVLRRAALEADEKEKQKRIASGIMDRVVRGALKPSRAEAVGTPASLVKTCLSTGTTTNRYEDAFVNRGPRPQRIVENAPDVNPLILKIVGTRKHVNTDHLLEYRVEISPIQLVALVNSGIQGTRGDDPNKAAPNTYDDTMFGDGSQTKRDPKKPPPEPSSVMRMWIPASMLHQVHPALVEHFAFADDAKKVKQAIKSKGKRKAHAVDLDDDEDSEISLSSPLMKTHTDASWNQPRQPNYTTTLSEGPSHRYDPWFADEDDRIAGPSRPVTFLFSFPDPDNSGALDDDIGNADDAGSGLNANAYAGFLDYMPKASDKNVPKSPTARPKAQVKVTATKRLQRIPVPGSQTIEEAPPEDHEMQPPGRYALSGRMSDAPKNPRAKKSTARSKRPRPSAPASFDRLEDDEPTSSRAPTIKRRKTTHSEFSTSLSSTPSISARANSTTAAVPPVRPWTVEILSDFDDDFSPPPPSSLSRAPTAKINEAIPIRKRTLHSFSSSQESGLVSADGTDDIIDLT